MTEKLPMLVMAERSPGPGWEEGRRRDAAEATGTATGLSVAELGAALAIEIAKSQELRAQMLTERQPATSMTFGDMVASVMASENISYGAAASKVSRDRPDLYDQHRRAPNGRYDYNDPEDRSWA